MKKTLLAAALMAGFAGIAHAETSVTLYGIVDGGIGYEQIKTKGADKATRTGIMNGVQAGNRWGLKGTEDLGNGLRAVFVLESGFDLGTGDSLQNNRLFGRQATLGLTGDSWGRLDFGRQTNIASKYYVDVHGNAWNKTGSGQAFRSTDTFRMDNMVMYQTPNFSGFQAGVGYSFNANGSQDMKVSGTTSRDAKAITTGLRYANGPIAAAASYDRMRGYNAAGGNYKYQSAWNLSGSYDFEVVALSLAFGQEYDGKFGGTRTSSSITQNPVFDNLNNQIGYVNDVTTTSHYGYNKGFDYNNYAVSLAAPIGAGKLSGTYHLSQPRKDAKSVGNEKKQHGFGLAYVHPLSKRTDVYAVGGYTKNYQNVDSAKRTLAGVGLTHRF